MRWIWGSGVELGELRLLWGFWGKCGSSEVNLGGTEINWGQLR